MQIAQLTSFLSTYESTTKWVLALNKITNKTGLFLTYLNVSVIKD